MDNLPQQIYKFAQVFSASRKRDIEKIFSDMLKNMPEEMIMSSKLKIVVIF